MEYANYKCKFCGEEVNESYPPSISMATVNEEERTIKPVKYFMKDLCTECCTKLQDEWNTARQSGASAYEKWRDPFIAKIRELYPEWKPWGITFVDSMFGSGRPNIFLIVKDIPEGVSLDDEVE